ncbi:hypothetical protein BDZ89DRAFT_1074617 [Hymenopellis radicata]|nr:hypothetical protein BDZ89DRAFT_1074617 [Hymenopellis radicata]
MAGREENLQRYDYSVVTRPEFTSLLLSIPPDKYLRDSERVPSYAEHAAIRSSLLPARLKLNQLDLALQAAKKDRDLPPEILEVIFRFACRRIYHIGYKEPLSFHWTIIRVCRRWRRIIINLPTLWARLRVRLSQLHLRFVLKCSKDAPLHVLCYGVLKTDLDSQRKSAVSAVEIRWRNADIRLSNFPLNVFLPLHHNLPMLQEIHVYVRPPMSVDLEDCHAPRLKVVTVYHPRTLVFDFPWIQLDADLYATHCAYMLDAISQAQNLQNFGFDCENTRIIDDDPFGRPPVVNRTIRGLILNESKLMDLITLPAAENMTLRFLDYDPTQLAERLLVSFSLFINRSQCNITHLKVDHCPPIERFRDLATQLQGLTSLQLFYYKRRSSEIDPLIKSVFVFLTGTDKDSPALPALHDFRLRVAPKFHFGSYLEAQVFTLTSALDAMLGMVNKHCSSSPPFRLTQIGVHIETDQKVALVDAVPDSPTNAAFAKLKTCSAEGAPRIDLRIRNV